MIFDGKRVRIMPYELWELEPIKDWWDGFFCGIFFTVIVSSLIVYLFS